jgi:hypothetical protein
MIGSERCHPKPKGPLPAAESYASDKAGEKPDRPAESAIGMVTEEVPETRLAVNFSPISRIAPPPFGREMEGAEKEEEVSRAGVG